MGGTAQSETQLRVWLNLELLAEAARGVSRFELSQKERNGRENMTRGVKSQRLSFVGL